ncbi:RNA polymerase sigma-70 factor [Rapidithrix thailandica]|uniref:RNA polymerase sigma-70 factor n=1 Tax=Rapidithrix thailandica TaxID=413964 RepID=A0AAW9RZT9_9BACT
MNREAQSHPSAALTIRLKKGELSALREIYLKHYDSFRQIATAYLKSTAEAEDVLQEAFIKLWEKRHLLKSERSYEGYLFMILKNTMVSALRARAKEVLQRDFSHMSLSHTSTEEQIHYRELSNRLEKAVDNLPPKRKQVFNLKRQQGLTNKQISEKLGISTQMVEKQLKLAKQTLKLSLSEEIPVLSLLLLLSFIG